MTGNSLLPDLAAANADHVPFDDNYTRVCQRHIFLTEAAARSDYSFFYPPSTQIVLLTDMLIVAMFRT